MLLTACSSEEPSGGQSSNSGGDGGSSGSSKKTVEIFSWWTGAGEEDGLLAIIDEFEKTHSDIKIKNAAVAGGAGTNAKAVLATRMQGGDPPSTFQVHGGAELNEGWVAAGKMEPLNSLYEKNGWKDKFPSELIDMVSKDGNIYSVPVNIHRGNVLWYNTKIFEENGLEPPETFEEFIQVADALKAKGITPLALGDKNTWPATQLFETVLLGTVGPDKYQKFWTGEVSFDDPGFRKAADRFLKIISYINKDHSSRTWQDASQLVSSGKAAMNLMGDWAKGYFVNDKNLKPKEDFGWVEPFGTEGNFMVITDTFGLPKGVKNPDAVKKFLTFLGSVKAQDIFNPLKGSIPARVDADPSKYDVYGKNTMIEFKKTTLVPSLAHGSAAAQGFLSQFNKAMKIFVTQQDVDQFVQSLEKASGQLK